MLADVKHIRVTRSHHHQSETSDGHEVLESSQGAVAPPIDIRVVDYGGRGNSPLVFLHGTGECAESFGTVAPQLTDIRHVVAFDQRGSAHSSWMNGVGRGYRWSDFLYDLREVSQFHFGEQKFDLVGSSIGGIQAVAAAALFPNLVNSIILVDSAPGALPNKIEILRRFVATRYATRDEAMRALSHGYCPIELDILLQEREGTWGIHFDHALLDVLRPSLFESSVEFASRVCCPVLVLQGEKSRLFSKESFQRFRDGLPTHAPLIEKVIPEAGHRIIKENPQAFLEATRVFLMRTLLEQSRK